MEEFPPKEECDRLHDQFATIDYRLSTAIVDFINFQKDELDYDYETIKKNLLEKLNSVFANNISLTDAMNDSKSDRRYTQNY